MNRKEAYRQARALTSRMTVEEMAGQLRYDAPAIDRLGIPAYHWWGEALHGVAYAGTATVFPQAIGLAATFDAPLVSRVARVIALEGRAKHNAATAQGDHGIYRGLTFWAPNINIFRDPRWGRGQETYGEDPWLTSRMGVAYIRGLQGSGSYLRAAACAKHFAVHSGPEHLRHEMNVEPSPKDLQETYLPAFEAAVREGHVEAVMGAYNRVNGEPCCGSKRLLTQILRDEWGFQGHVVSDCFAIADFHTRHHVTDTAPESAAMALMSGCDLNCGTTYLQLLLALEEGRITRADIERACVRLMVTRLRLGLMDDKCQYHRIRIEENDTPAHHKLALEAAKRSMTLLKNDGVLPLDMRKIKKLAIIGPNADSRACLDGNYSGVSSRYITYLSGLRTLCGSKVTLMYSPGCALNERIDENHTVSEAVAIAQQADAVILCLGLNASLEGEEGDIGNRYFSGDKFDLELPAVQRELLAAVAAAGKPLITVLSAGSALRAEEGNAIIWAGYPGQAGGQALAELIAGRFSPAGRLPITFYRSVDDLPPFECYNMRNRTYRYFEGEALYPFGYGLSYTTFKYSNAVFDAAGVSVTVVNAGAMDSDEVIQAYIRPDSPDAPMFPALCAFTRTHIRAGQAVRVTLPLSRRAFTAVNLRGERSDCRRAVLYVGGGQPDPRTRQLTGTHCLCLNIENPYIALHSSEQRGKEIKC